MSNGFSPEKPRSPREMFRKMVKKRPRSREEEEALLREISSAGFLLASGHSENGDGEWGPSNYAEKTATLSEYEMRAVQRNGMALSVIPHSRQTVELCRAAIAQCPEAERFVSPEILEKIENENEKREVKKSPGDGDVIPPAPLEEPGM